jgi:hypothetical protein
MGTKQVFNPLSSTFDITDDNNNTALTGIPTAPTAAALTSTTQIATTQFVQSALFPASVAIPAFDIDWNSGNVFYKDVSSAPTFTFSNVIDGKDIVVAVRNTSGSSVTATFPTTIKDASFSGLISAGKECIFTFVRYNSKTAATVVSDLV